MIFKIKKLSIFFLYLSLIIFFTIKVSFANSQIIKKINIDGNQRISDETIKLFSDIKINEKISNDKLNAILKNLYESNFFETVSVNFIDETIFIKVVEAPIIDVVEYRGIKADKIKSALNSLINLKMDMIHL